MGPRGDALLQMDWCLGQLLDTLDKLKLAEKTIVILTSDNGPVVDDGYKDDAVAKLGSHKPSGGLRGGKYSLFEAGTRVPFILQWSGRVKPGVSDALISQVDVYATLAALTGGAAPQCSDGENVLAALLGESATGREVIIEHAQNPQTLAIRDAQWKLIERGNGAKRNSSTDTELGNDPQFQLYDLKADPAETTNVAAAHPERVEALRARLATIREKGRQIK
jgi:arylsulfatase A-like enzyme